MHTPVHTPIHAQASGAGKTTLLKAIAGEGAEGVLTGDLQVCACVLSCEYDVCVCMCVFMSVCLCVSACVRECVRVCVRLECSLWWRGLCE